MTPPRTPKIPYGGDHNPEQWPEEVGDEDHRLFTEAGIDTLTVGVFSWSLTQPAEDTYDFTVLDRVLDRAVAEGRRLCLATTTDLLTGEHTERDEPFTLDPLGVPVLRLQ